MKHVYLASDKSDVASDNVFTDFQSAYNEANSIQKSTLDRVVIIVVNTKIETVGDLILSENWNPKIELQGSGIEESSVGSIIGATKKGNGYSVGDIDNPCVFNQVRIGNIVTNALGNRGNSGSVGISGHAFRIGNIDTSIKNTNNISGNGGDVSYTNTPENAGYVNDIITTSIGTNSSSGNVTIDVKGACAGNITTANSNYGGNVVISDALIVGVISCRSTNGGIALTRVKKLQGVFFSAKPSNTSETFIQFIKALFGKIINFFKKK